MKQLLLLISILSALTVSFAQTTSKIDDSFLSPTLVIKTGEILPRGNLHHMKPVQTVDTLDDGIRVTITFEKLRMYRLPEQQNKIMLAWLGYHQTNTSGRPSLPDKVLTFEKPVGVDVSLKVEQLDFVEHQMELAAAEEVYFPGHEKPLKPIENYEGYYPDPQHQFYLEYPEYIRDNNRVGVYIVPVSYNQSTKTARIPTKLVFRLTFSEPLAKQKKTTPIAITNREPSIDLPGDLLIITSPEFNSLLKNFISWKKTLGYNVVLSCAPKWETPKQVMDTISLYRRNVTNLKDLLIIGSTDIVPSNYSTLNEPHITDLYYSYDPQDSQPKTNDQLYSLLKLREGRIPASNTTELRAAINKIMTYEKCDIKYSDNFFDQSLHCSDFQDGDSVNQKDEFDACESLNTRFIENSEEIAKLSERQGIKVCRVYNSRTANVIRPQFYSCRNEFDIREMPAHLQTLAWNGNAADIQNSLKQGVCYVLYRGHGSNYAWFNPSYDTECIVEEYNTNSMIESSPDRDYKYLRPIVFSISCMAGAFNQDKCFAKTSLTHHRGGSSAIIAATHKSLSAWNNSLSVGLFCSLYNDTISNDFLELELHRIQDGWRVGHLLNQGLIHMTNQFNKQSFFPHNKYQYEMYHCFGDPTMMIRTKKPSIFENVIIDKNERHIKVNTGEGPAYIAFYDHITNTSICKYAQIAEFDFAPDNWTENEDKDNDVIKFNSSTIAIYGPDRIPYIFKPFECSSIPFYEIQLEKCYFTADRLWASTDNPFKENTFLIVTNAFSGITLMQVPLTEGTSDIDIDASSIPSGTYIVSIRHEGRILDHMVVKK